MNKWLCGVVTALVACALAACGGGSGSGPKDEAPDRLLADEFAPEDGVPDGAGLDGPDGLAGEGVEVTEDTGQVDVPPQPGEFGWPCSEPTECDSGFCVESPQGKVCTQFCVDECPGGWSCKTFTMGSDVVSLCVPLYLYLCDPCMENKDCNSEFTGGEALCVYSGGNGRFCGGDCSGGKTCPSGYECREVSDAAGNKKPQCVPPEGTECQCSTRAIQLGLSTECFVMNEWGQCTGTRKCVVTGLKPCDAKTPAKEECNGLDDDCDGLTDEVQGQVPCSKKNEFGECPGFGECVGGVIVGCDARDPAPEVCNGLDDDCNGATDDAICYDGNPCTQDGCDVGSGACVFTPIAGPCDDGNLCTLSDHCENGQCVGGSPKVCDDGNPCTDDVCDSGTGECKSLNNSKPCEDGNKCTINDRCLNGICGSGTWKDCNDDNPCTLNEKCDPATGNCVFTSNEGAPCDDQNVCTKGELCSGGKCLGGKDYCEATAVVCVPGPGQLFCLAPSCVEVFGFPTCPCICF